jgi:hypothetical protein
MHDSKLPDGTARDRATGRRLLGGRRISSILEALPKVVAGDRISFGDLVDAFDGRAYGPLIVLFAAPNILPVALPGISAILGVPLILLTAQLMLGRRRPWLPAFVRRRSLARRDFERFVGKVVPRLRRIETWIRPRYLILTGPVARRLIGAGGLMLALIICLPVPLGNAVPGLSLVLMAVGLLGRDGLAVIAGGLAGLAGLAIVSGFAWGIVEASTLFARHGLGL